uniref:CACN subunit beta associated regulatory protein n=1 Tax=Salmo trutta TaxID=8032 RepID=A0A674DY97_SALTR
RNLQLTCPCRPIWTERFLSTGTQGGRRVSFNEAALFNHGRKALDKGRRSDRSRRPLTPPYTLTEGDFHHLKNARLTHLHIPPLALKIVTIHECESSENSIAMTTRPAAKSSLSIFQVTATALTSLSVSPSSALPGDTLNSVVDSSFSQSSLGASVTSVTGASPSAGVGQGPVLQFFTKLRRHASLEGASPYFKKWKLDSSQRASSLDTRGSPKRRQFQRQRAASESMDKEDNDAHHMDLIQYIARTQDVTYHPSPSASARLLSPSSSSKPPPSLGRGGGGGGAQLQQGPGTRVDRPESLASDHQALYRDIWTLRASLEQYGSSDQINNDRDSVRSDADSVSSLGVVSERVSDGESGNRKLMQMDSGYMSIEAPSRMFTPREAQPHSHPPLSLHRRDYSIDKKTDALFHEFLRHDPQFDQQESPRKHRSRIHLRKQWQRNKQYSDPGVRYQYHSFERQRTPLRRGDSVNYPLDTGFHSTLPRIVSAPDEEANEGAPSTPQTPKAEAVDRLVISTLDQRIFFIKYPCCLMSGLMFLLKKCLTAFQKSDGC